MVQSLRLHASTAGGVDSIPCWGTKISHAVWHGKKKKSLYYMKSLVTKYCFEIQFMHIISLFSIFD